MIEVRNLTKKYGDHTVVNHLNFTIEPGKIYGFLGPNGAGKSTTMNMITGCLAPTDGQVLIDGHDIYEDALSAKRCIGYLPEIPPVYPDMTPEEYLRFVAEAKGIKPSGIFEEVYRVNGRNRHYRYEGQADQKPFKRLQTESRHRTGYARGTEADHPR